MLLRGLAPLSPERHIRGMFGLGTWELLIVLLVVLLVFGASRLPALGKGLGQGMRSFRDAIKGIEEEGDARSVEKPSPSSSESNEEKSST